MHVSDMINSTNKWRIPLKVTPPTNFNVGLAKLSSRLVYGWVVTATKTIAFIAEKLTSVDFCQQMVSHHLHIADFVINQIRTWPKALEFILPGNL